MGIQEKLITEGHELLKRIEVETDSLKKIKLCEDLIEILEELDVDIETYNELWNCMGIGLQEYIQRIA